VRGRYPGGVSYADPPRGYRERTSARTGRGTRTDSAGTPPRWRAVGGVRRGCSRVLECAAAAARPRATRAVLSCAGAYVVGAAGSNECPAGSVRIEAEAACRTAAAAAGKTILESIFVMTASSFPRGCYTRLNLAYFNPHAVGAGSSGYQLLCATATSGAQFTRRCATRVYCAVLVGGVSNNANGLNIDAHAYIRMYVYAHMYTYDSDGARWRCRAAHGSAGGQRTGVQGRGT
jgi:hypothetical protein